MVAARIAFRFLGFNKSQTVLIIIGLAVGIAVQIFVGSLLQNLQEGFLNNIVDKSPHVSVVPAEDELFIGDWESLVDEIKEIDGINTIGVTAESPAQALKGNKSLNVLVRGLDPEISKSIYQIDSSVYEGRMPSSGNEILIGKDFSEENGIDIGDTLTLAAVKGFQTTIRNFTVSGLFDLNNPALNNLWVIVTLETAQDFLGLGSNISAIETQVDDVFAADIIADKVEDRLKNDKIVVENWKDLNPTFFSAVSAQSASSYMIQFFVLMSVVIGIASVLSITVIQKSRQLGILKAMGIKDRQAAQIFMFQGLFIGIGGAAVGLILGSILFYGFIQAILSSGNSFITADFNIPFMVASAVVAVLSSVGASILPALKSRKLNPMEVIRNA
jgi:lipoprotein-releasing system permease protein